MNFVKLIIITLFLAGCSVELVQNKIAPASRIQLDTEYVMRSATTNPWYDRSRDLYVIPREIKDNWVRYEYTHEGVQKFSESRTYEFLIVFDRVEE